MSPVYVTMFITVQIITFYAFLRQFTFLTYNVCVTFCNKFHSEPVGGGNFVCRQGGVLTGVV